jgi:hypothetical protein
MLDVTKCASSFQEENTNRWLNFEASWITLTNQQLKANNSVTKFPAEHRAAELPVRTFGDTAAAELADRDTWSFELLWVYIFK